jgi:hypothetical protein
VDGVGSSSSSSDVEAEWVWWAIQPWKAGAENNWRRFGWPKVCGSGDQAAPPHPQWDIPCTAPCVRSCPSCKAAVAPGPEWGAACAAAACAAHVYCSCQGGTPQGGRRGQGGVGVAGGGGGSVGWIWTPSGVTGGGGGGQGVLYPVQKQGLGHSISSETAH